MNTFGKNLITLVKTAKGAVIHLNEDPANLAQDDPALQEGYIKLMQKSSRMSETGYMNAHNRYFTFFGKVEGLENFIDERIDDNGRLPGRIIIKEFLESEVPAALQLRFYNHKSEEPEKYYVKKAGDGGPILYKDGERIMRFPIYFEHNSPQAFDVFLVHDNKDEVNEWRVASPDNAKKENEGVVSEEPVGDGKTSADLPS